MSGNIVSFTVLPDSFMVENGSDEVQNVPLVKESSGGSSEYKRLT